MTTNAVHDPFPIDPEPVGKVLAAELEARTWSQADFAAILARPTQFVSEIINGKKEITRESAAQIGAALGQTAEMWLNLQDQFFLVEQAKNLHAKAKLDDVRTRAQLTKTAPIELLRKRGILRATALDDLVQEVKELFEIDTLEDEPAFLAAARRANKDEDLSVLQRAWFACIRKQARLRPPVKPYNPKKLQALARGLSNTLLNAQDFEDLPDRFREAGVRLVFVDAFPTAKIDGGAMYVDGYPVIGLSGRGKRLDKVLFTLLHEIAHLLLTHVDADHSIIEEIDDAHPTQNAQEKDADDEAGKLLFPEDFPHVPARISGPWVDQVAAELSVARIVVIGHLQHERRLDWRTTLAKNAPAVGE
ncbi:MAG: ImmA/IrrE family metallo-endopeptidase, partial [Actinobacteria bacterium]|nr:ImmA/IrrE family metallo-endopeptidase [Actinomycetota bacterium]